MVSELQAELRRSIRRLGREGYSVTTIAQLCGVSRPTVRKYLELDIDEENRSTTPPVNRYDTTQRDSGSWPDEQQQRSE